MFTTYSWFLLIDFCFIELYCNIVKTTTTTLPKLINIFEYVNITVRYLAMQVYVPTYGVLSILKSLITYLVNIN